MKKYWPYGLFAALALLVVAPLYGRGYVFLLDMVFAPSLQLPQIVNGAIPASYPIFAIIVILGNIIGAVVVQKIILTLLLFLPAVFMYRLAASFSDSGILNKPWAVVAGVFYAFNPWTYERWLSGQWLVLLGYALFPLAVAWLWDVLEFFRAANPDYSHVRRNVWRFAVLAALYPIVDLHFAYIFVWFAALFLIVWAVAHRKSITRSAIWYFIKILILVGVLALAVNSFWIIGALHGGGTLSSITGEDFRAFVTQTDPHFGPWFNVVSLYGFWSTDYTLPKDGFPLWWVSTLVFLALAVIGAVRGWKKKQPLLIAASLAFIPALILAVGYASGFSMAITQFFAAVIPGFRGLRETEKLGGVLAFVYSLLIAVAGRWLSEKPKRDERLVLTFVGVFILLAVYCMPFAFFSQVSASEYPASWYEVSSAISADAPPSVISQAGGPARILVFPWEAYIDLSFAGFHQVANPASTFFGPQVIASTDTGNPDLAASTGLWDKYAFNLVQGSATVDQTVTFLKSQNVGYILLLKESDWQRYSFLSDNKHLREVIDEPELTLYRVN